MAENQRDLNLSIQRAHREKSQLYLWLIQNRSIISVPVSLEKRDQYHLFLKINPIYRQQLEIFIGGSGLINLMIPDESLLLSCEYRELDEDLMLKVSLPKNYHYYDRREFGRYHFAKPQSCVIENSSQEQLKKECLDIGAGGFSLSFNKREEKFFKTVGDLGKVKFDEGPDFINVKVVSIKNVKQFDLEHDPYATKRVSLSFVDVGPKWTKAIEDFIKHTEDIKYDKS